MTDVMPAPALRPARSGYAPSTAFSSITKSTVGLVARRAVRRR